MRLNGSIYRGFRKGYPKLWILADCKTHLVLSTHCGRGPGSDLVGLEELLNGLEERYRFKTLLADAGFDCERVHELIHKLFNARSVIPPTKIRKNTTPKKPFRRKMGKLFRTGSPKIYKKRWQIETVFSMIKRNLSPALTARTKSSQNRELSLLAITHNIIITAALFLNLLKAFYRALRCR